MSIITFFIGPVVGAVIGGFTNKVAIRMLFRPYTAKHIGKLHVPLTPGIIPKEKGRIAESVGGMVSEKLLNREVMSATLLSDGMMSKISAALDGLQERMMNDAETLTEFLLQYVSAEELRRIETQLGQDASRALCVKLADDAIGRKVAGLVVDQVQSRLQRTLWGRLGAKVLDSMRESAEELLADNINEMLCNNSGEMVGNLIHTETQKLLATPVRELCRGKEALFARLKEMVIAIYSKVVPDSLPKALEAIDIQRIVQDRINEMDMAETEGIILEVMDKELKALVWFGVLLGFLLGFVTNIL